MLIKPLSMNSLCPPLLPASQVGNCLQLLGDSILPIGSLKKKNPNPGGWQGMQGAGPLPFGLCEVAEEGEKEDLSVPAPCQGAVPQKESRHSLPR